MPISPLPAAPSRAQSPASFATSADAFLGQLPTFAAEATALEQAVNAAEIVVVAAKSATIAAKNAAQAAQAAAESTAGATAWKTGTAYAAGDCVYGTDGQTYRALAASTGVNPVGDATGKWVRISATGAVYEDISPGGTLVSGGYRLSSTGSYALPMAPSKNMKLEFVLDCAPTEGNKITISRSGKTIDGRAENLTIEDGRITTWVMVYNGATWRVLV